MGRRPYSAVASLLVNATVVLLVTACVTISSGLGETTAPGDSAAGSDVAAVTVAPPTAGPLRTKKPKRTPAPTASTAPTATETPIPTATAPPTAAVTVDPAATPFCCLTFRLPPIGDFPSGLVLEPVNPTLDYSAAPNYGTQTLSAGFSPDPVAVAMTSGGDVDVSYLGSSCSGYATSAPDLRINFSGSAALLRLYIVASSGDTTMIVNDPFGNFYCVDDSFGTVNPTIDFNNPAGGTYDIWIGSYAKGTFVSGTFYITSNGGNHP